MKPLLVNSIELDTGTFTILSLSKNVPFLSSLLPCPQPHHDHQSSPRPDAAFLPLALQGTDHTVHREVLLKCDSSPLLFTIRSVLPSASGMEATLLTWVCPVNRLLFCGLLISGHLSHLQCPALLCTLVTVSSHLVPAVNYERRFSRQENSNFGKFALLKMQERFQSEISVY